MIMKELKLDTVDLLFSSVFLAILRIFVLKLKLILKLKGNLENYRFT